MSRRRRKKSKKRHSHGKGPAAQPKVHVKVALADKDFRAATALIRPALLYADRVTIHSPIASLLNAAMNLGKIPDRRAKIDTVLEIIAKVPSFAEQIAVSPEALEQFKAVVSVDPRLVRRVGRAYGASKDIDAMYEGLKELDSIWEEQMPGVLHEVKSKFGAEDLFEAVTDGCVEVADLGVTSNTDYIAASLRASTGDSQGDDFEQEIAAFTSRLVEILTERRSFPLLDAASADLARSVGQEARVEVPYGSIRRGAEVSSAVSFMGFLPSFENLGIDEILDLRIQLSGSLVRFRGALSKLSREFEMRPIDEGFNLELEDAWRQQVAPALHEIRETLAEHGLLKEVASVALGDPRRLMIEAGGVIATGHAEVFSLPGLMTAGLAVGLPIADTVGRALARTIEARREVRKNAFFFLHQLESEAVKKG